MAPNPRVVSKIRGKMGIYFFPCSLREDPAAGPQGLGPGGTRARRRGLVERTTREDHLPRSGRVRTAGRLTRKRNGRLRAAASPSLSTPNPSWLRAPPGQCSVSTRHPMFAGFRSPCRPDRPHPVGGRISFSRRKSRLPPVLHIFDPPFVYFCVIIIFCRRGANAMVDNNTPYFGMTAKFSRPKRRKIDNGRECLKALPKV